MGVSFSVGPPLAGDRPAIKCDRMGVEENQMTTACAHPGPRI